MVIVYDGHRAIVKTVRLWLNEVLDLNNVLIVRMKLRGEAAGLSTASGSRQNHWLKEQLKH